jgi:hypothetical protein
MISICRHNWSIFSFVNSGTFNILIFLKFALAHALSIPVPRHPAGQF